MTTEGKRIAKPVDEAGDYDMITCSCCNRRLKSNLEWIRSDDGVLCENCYHHMLCPGRKIGPRGLVE